VLDDFTLADVSVAVQTFTIVDRFDLDLTAYPNITAWTERCRKRPARQKIEALLHAAKPVR
jgi:glutathione S-transferase